MADNGNHDANFFIIYDSSSEFARTVALTLIILNTEVSQLLKNATFI